MTDYASSWPERLAVAAGGAVGGRVRVPSSKSVSHRCFNLALLARTPITVERPLEAEDTALFVETLRRCGFAVQRLPDGLRLEPGPVPASAELYCGNAGTLFRFLVSSLAAMPGEWTVDGTPRLRERPIRPLVDALRRLGAEIRYLEEEGYAPLAIRGGSLGAGTTRLDAGSSSQYLSSLLMAGLVAPGEIVIELEALTSEPYVALTLEAIRAFGGSVEEIPGRGWRTRPGLTPPATIAVEGDFSAAAYPAAAAALTGGAVEIEGVRQDSAQGDRGFLDLLARMGAQVEWRPSAVRVTGSGRLRALTADLSAMPDQVPTLAALAPFAEGITRIDNVPHLRIKECDRLAAMAAELSRLGVPVEERPDGLTIPGVWAGEAPPENAVTVETYDDHRIAMSLALVALRRSGVTVRQPGVVEKSYPEFWNHLESMRAAAARG